MKWIVFTHGHPDPLEPGVVKMLVESTGAAVIGNQEVAAKLRGEGLAVEVFEHGEKTLGAFYLEAMPAKHQLSS